MAGWIFFEINLRELEHGGSRSQPVLLQMHECTSELDETLVKVTIRTLPVSQPKIFQHIMRLVKLLTIEQHKIAGITRVHPATDEGGGQCGDSFMLTAHPNSLKSNI